MRILAIDPGTKCGWAMTDGPRVRVATSGVWDLSPRRFEGGGMRYVRLIKQLDQVQAEIVVYEEVRRHLGTDAAHCYGGIVATISAHCEDRKVPYTAIPVGTIKRHGTGKGNASKDQMLAAAQARWGPTVIYPDQADALWILDCYLSQMGESDEARSDDPAT